MEKDIVLEMKGINKSFPGVKALDNAKLTLKKGTVHALMGENGAGKSTLMNCLFGIYQKDSGEIYLNGNKVELNNPREGINHGIAMIHQELQPVPDMTIAENIFLGAYPMKGVFVDHKKINEDAKYYLDAIGLDVSPETLLGDLTISQQQSVEIAKALSQEARIIIMDEPTSSLTETEVENLFRIIKDLQERDISIIYISHKMDEILRISDEITIMRDGQYVGTYSSSDITVQEIIQLMVGRELTSQYPEKQSKPQDENILEVKNFTSPSPLSFKDCSFELKKGEVLGVAGLVGAQRSELMEAVFGLRDKEDGAKVIVKGEEVAINSPHDAIELGIALVTEDRRESGIFGVLSIRDNITVASLDNYKGANHLLSENKMEEVTKEQIESLQIRTPSSKTAIQNLSGGNQQKVIISRWLATNPDILILDEPTRGIDVGAKYEIYEIINELQRQGKSIILISSELSEILGMSDRIMVMCEGRISGYLDAKDASQEKVMELATKFMV